MDNVTILINHIKNTPLDLQAINECLAIVRSNAIGNQLLTNDDVLDFFNRLGTLVMSGEIVMSHFGNG